MHRQISLLFCTALIAGLMGCATAPPVVLKLLPPADLLQECVAPTYSVVTNADLASGILLERNALAICNIDKASLRAWATKE